MSKEVEKLTRLMHAFLWTDSVLVIWFVKNLLVLL